MTAHARRPGPAETTAETAETAPEPRKHERLGPYRLLQRLGEGGMGVVHLALDPQGRAVAVKVLRPHIAYDPEARSRLEREVETLSRVRDERVAAVIDADIYGERPYLVTRYVPGPSLDEVVGERGPLPGVELHRIGRGLVDALWAIHSVGIVHRDLKPGNVLLEDGEPVLIDFGIAHVADDVRLTSVGLVMGTPGYLSPEVLAGGAVTEATDWWGWAATLAFAASGRPPFGRGPMDVVLDRVRRGESDLTGVDPLLRPLLGAALSPDPRQRPPVGEVVVALERYAAGRPATISLPAPWSAPTVDPLRRREESPPREQWVDQRWVDEEWAGAEWAHEDQEAAPRTSALPQVEPEWARQGESPTGAGAGDEPGGPRAELDPRIGRPLRTGSLVALGAALAAAAMSWPGVVVLVVAGWCWVARFSDRTVSALVVRRFERGRRRSDVPRAVAASPWHLAVSAVGTVAGLVLPLLVTAAATVGASIALAALVPALSGAPGRALGPALGVGFVVGAIVAWWGPGGASLRRGSRSVVRTVVPGGAMTQVVVGLLVAGALALAVLSFLHEGQVSWWPRAGNPLRGLLAS